MSRIEDTGAPGEVGSAMPPGPEDPGTTGPRRTRPAPVDDLGGFDDLLAANRRYATSAPRPAGHVARAGLAVVTCMDARLQPLAILGLFLGEAEILRTPGGRLTEDAELGCVQAVELLGVTRILLITHSQCELFDSALNERDRPLGVVSGLNADVQRLAGNARLAGRAAVAGFHYDVDSGLLQRIC